MTTYYERILSLLSLKYVDDVIFDVELKITKEFLLRYDITTVIRNDSLDRECYALGKDTDIDNFVCEKYSLVAGKLQVVDYEFELTISEIIDRVELKEEEYIKRNKKKASVTYNNGIVEKQRG